MQTVVITGANGYLGSRLVLSALKQGLSVIAIVRPKGTISGLQRITQALDALVGPKDADPSLENLTIVESDISNLDKIDTNKIPLKAIFIHAAALVKTNYPEDVIWNTNVRGTEKALALAKLIDAKCFIGVGTAYSCGSAPKIPNQIEVSTGFRFSEFNNAYEKSKNRAEQLVFESSIPSLIMRPSILTHAPRFGKETAESPIGLLGWLKLIETTIDIAERNGIDNLTLPIKSEAKLNFIDVDKVAAAIIEISSNVARNKVSLKMFNRSYFLVSKDPKSTKEIIEAVVQRTAFANINCDLDLATSPLNRAEKFYVKFGEFFTDYASQFISFAHDNSLSQLILSDDSNLFEIDKFEDILCSSFLQMSTKQDKGETTCLSM